MNKMNKRDFLLLFTVLSSSVVNVCALADVEAFPGDLFNPRAKRQADFQTCQALKDSYEASCGGRELNYLRYRGLNYYGVNCNRGEGALFEEGYDDWCSNITTFTSLCQREAPRVACLDDRLNQQNCTASSWVYSFVGEVCSATGLDLASRAMASNCMSNTEWNKQREVRRKFYRCFNYNIFFSCSARERYAQCNYDVTQQACGADYARLAKIFINALVDSINSYTVGRSAAEQCGPVQFGDPAIAV